MAERAKHLGQKFTQLTRGWGRHLHVANIEVQGADFSIQIDEDPKGGR